MKAPQISRSASPEHLGGVIPGCRGDVHAAQHAGDLLDARDIIERRHLAHRLSPLLALGNPPLPVRTRRNLRQVRDAEYLTITSELRQQLADDLGHATTDAYIDLVEHERRHCVVA